MNTAHDTAPDITWHALLYVRVSSEKQVVEGHGIDGQEHRCRIYAESKNYPIEKVFPDKGISGGLFERPAMQLLLKHIDENPGKKFIVIFDDLSRFARDLQVHLRLKTEIIGRGARVECPNFKFEDTPEGVFVENMMAAQSQLYREQNRRQVIQKMKARLEAGYWPFAPVPGFTMVRDPVHGKLLTPQEPYASIFKEGIESVRDGLLSTIEEFRYFVLQKYNEYGLKKKLSSSAAKDILTEILYAGWIEYPNWGITLRQGHHQGFITLDTYNTVQERLNGNSRPRKRKDYSADFALRGFVLCDACGGKLTASWSKGRGRYYANYCCMKKGCSLRYKSISKAKIDAEFEYLLDMVKPCDEVLELAKEVFQERWDEKASGYFNEQNHIQQQVRYTEQQISNYLSRIGRATDENLIQAYEQEVSKLTVNKRLLEASINKKKYTSEEFGTASETVFTALKNPITLWKSEDYADKKSILLMYFDDSLRYDYERGFGTASLAYPLDVIGRLSSDDSYSVQREGFEPS